MSNLKREVQAAVALEFEKRKNYNTLFSILEKVKSCILVIIVIVLIVFAFKVINYFFWFNYNVIENKIVIFDLYEAGEDTF